MTEALEDAVQYLDRSVDFHKRWKGKIKLALVCTIFIDK